MNSQAACENFNKCSDKFTQSIGWQMAELVKKIGRIQDRLQSALMGPVQRIYSVAPVSVIRPLLQNLAIWHRRRLRPTTFIGVVGSAGKTTTKGMIGAVLKAQYRVSFRRGTANYAHSIPESILMARSSDQFCVVELSAGSGPGSLCKPLDLLKPDVGVVTCIGTDHYSAFGSQDAIALEKGRLIRELPENGVAVLNADDPRVIAMRADCRARVVTYGLSAGADVRAESICSAWPDKLSFELVYKGARVRVQTLLCGTQWVSGALAAAAVGITMDVPLSDIARSLGSIEPYAGRMSPLMLPDGVTFIRDDWKASMQTIPPALEFMRVARATRKIAVIGTISDYAGASRKQYVSTARQALKVCDMVAFVGPRASVALRARPAGEPERLRAFSNVKAATAFFSHFLQPDDLVLLKGSNPADHLYRIALSRFSPVACWREDCSKGIFCDSCRLVSGNWRQSAKEKFRQHARATTVATKDIAISGEVVVGLGNFGETYVNTPHNVGHAVLDRIVGESGSGWSETSNALIAKVDWRGSALCLIKPKTLVNNTGQVLHDLFKASDLEPTDVILVFDDIDLPMGTVRSRMRGSDGGHRGVRSILEAFQTDQFRRIKIGVRRPAESEVAREAVLRPFSKIEEPLVSEAVETACSRLQDVLKSDGRGRSKTSESG